MATEEGNFSAGVEFQRKEEGSTEWTGRIVGIDDNSPKLRAQGLMAVFMPNGAVFTVPRGEKFLVDDFVKITSVKFTREGDSSGSTVYVVADTD